MVVCMYGSNKEYKNINNKNKIIVWKYKVTLLCPRFEIKHSVFVFYKLYLDENYLY